VWIRSLGKRSLPLFEHLAFQKTAPNAAISRRDGPLVQWILKRFDVEVIRFMFRERSSMTRGLSMTVFGYHWLSLATHIQVFRRGRIFDVYQSRLS
jgi:hypothetical protein